MRSRALLAAAAGVLLAMPPWSPSTLMAQTVDEIIAKNIEARGGKEKLASIQSARASGKMTMGPMEVPFTLEWKAPNRIRQEFTVQGKAGVRAYDGSTAWMHMPFMGKAEPEKMAAEDTADMAQEADLIEGPLVNYKEKGHQVRLVGKKEIEGTEVYDLEVTMKNGDVAHDYLDAETFLTIKQESKMKQGDQEMEIVTSIGNYQSVDGLMLPFSISSTIKGAPAGAGGQSVTVDKYELGGTIDDSRFAFPGAAAAEKPAETKPPGR